MLVKDTQSDEVRLAEARRPSRTAYAFGAFRLVPQERKLLLANEPVHLGSRAFAMLVALVERAGTTVSADKLMRLVWPGVTVEEANLRVQLGSLRKALARGEGGRGAIETVPLRGYCFVIPVARTAGPANSASGEAEHNLPTSLTPTVGRTEAIELLVQSLASHRLVTILGPGGIGKTTVALAVARQSLPYSPMVSGLSTSRRCPSRGLSPARSLPRSASACFPKTRSPAWSLTSAASRC
jgi:DNA-binding winged helix-turn-helix (wHTH) protein